MCMAIARLGRQRRVDSGSRQSGADGTPPRFATSLTPESSAQPSARLESLEQRLLMAATPAQIANVLDLPTGTTVTYTGDPSAVSIRTVGPGGSGLFLFPTGGDDYLLLSTGNADDIDSLPNSSGSQGTDLGASGETDDRAEIAFSLDVPTFQANVPVSLKLDFTFLSEEFPEFVGSSFNDTLSILINGNEIALDQAGNPMNVNNALFNGALPTTGTFFDGRTEALTAAYNVPAGTTQLDIQISIEDQGDGIYDSAVIIDNIRFQPAQVVYLDIDGADVDDFFGYGTDYDVPAFSATDIGGFSTQTQEAIDTIIAQLQAKFAGYDIFFTDEIPEFDQYMTVVLGGSNQTPINIVPGKHPVLANQIGAQAPFSRYYEARNPNLKGRNWTLFGQAQLQNGVPDIGNAVLDDMAVVFTQEFKSQNIFANINDLVNVIAHQVANNLGARDVSNAYPGEVLKVDPLPLKNAGFGSGRKQLAQTRWFDGATQIDVARYLQSVIGRSEGDRSSLIPLSQAEPGNFQPHYKLIVRSGSPIYNAVVGIIPGASGTSRQDDGVIFYEFDRIDGSVLVPLPTQYRDARIYIYGSSTPGGPIDLFTGRAGKDGLLTFEETQLKLFKRNGDVRRQFVMSQGTPINPVANEVIFIEESAFDRDGFLFNNMGRFTDIDGDVYEIALIGQGQLRYEKLRSLSNKGGIERLEVVGGTRNTQLRITVRKARGGNGQVEMLTLDADQLQRVFGSSVNLGTELNADFIRSIDLNHVRPFSQINIASPNLTDLTELDLSIVGNNAVIKVDGIIDLRAHEVQPNARIEAARANDIVTTGSKRRGAKAKGHFLGDIALSGEGVPLGRNVFNTISVRGRARGLWQAVGDTNRILINKVASFLRLDFKDSTLNQFVARKLVSSTLDVQRRISRLSVQQAGANTTINTGTLGTVDATGGNRGGNRVGRFDVSMNLTGDYRGLTNVPTIDNLKARTVANQTWNVVGNINRVSIGDATSLNLDVEGGANVLDFNFTNLSTLALTNGLNRFTGRSFQGSSINAQAINTVDVSGTVRNAQVASATSINRFASGSLLGSDVTAGVDPNFDLDNLAPGVNRTDVFANLSSRIKRVIINRGRNTGRIATDDARIVAFNVDTVALGRVQPNNGGNFFGVAGVNVLNVSANGDDVAVPPAGQPGGVVPIAGDAVILFL